MRLARLILPSLLAAPACARLRAPARACARHTHAPDVDTPSSHAAAVGAARERWNAGVAAHDTAALARLVDDSIIQASPYFVRGGGRARYVAGFARQFAQRPRFAMVYTPERIETSAVFGGVLATEYGHWRETWFEQGEPTEIRGTYYAVWREQAGAWMLVREVFAPHACTGPRYCTRP